jgi:hypothetical protein
MNKKVVAYIVDLLAIALWVLAFYKLYTHQIELVWDGIAYIATGLIVFVVEDSLITTATKSVINALTKKLGGS